ncbi:pilus assembly protein [Marinobacter fonticola]|uniref:pilus assembly protein n=1 Tax=Marinobacter fonticola TaxID=2603215 RepID=UPI0011E79DA6|nr:PilC/PilY family type IV pilus protein [Marinobacter fonticola]
MKKLSMASIHFALGLGLTLPAASFAAPVTPASKPLFLDGAVKHNVMLAIDDSGSMDFETLFSNNDGAVWLGEDGSFVKASGEFNDAGESGVLSQGNGGKYVYILPNGRNGTYDGKKINSGHQAVPPIKPFAFVRSGAFNKAYYDPNVTYEPWPSYGGFTFNDIDPTEAPFDIMINKTSTLDLTSNINTSSRGQQWGFEIEDSDMPCTDGGGACNATGTAHYTYYPAHYYVVRDSGTYTFTPKSSVDTFYKTNSSAFEAEDATILGNGFRKASDSGSPVLNNASKDSASNKDYVGVPSSKGETSNTPPGASEGQLEFSFYPKTTATHRIWIRRRMPNGSSDSLWINLRDKSQSDVQVTWSDNDSYWSSLGGQDWNKWWSNHEHSSDWVWQSWALVDFNSTSQQQHLRIRFREGDVYVDQILITADVDKMPGGPVVLEDAPGEAVVRSCDDPQPSHYREFFADTSQFSGVDAIGPKGQCLDRIDIESTKTSYSYVDTEGNAQTRTYAQEITNFANWFTYYRRRHQAMRGGLGAAFQGIGGIQAGLFWINNRRNVSMYDMDSETDLSAFLKEHYNYVSSGGTPNREALKHAGEQLKRTGNGAPITLECQKNFTLLFTDGFSSKTDPGGIGNEDRDAGAPYADSYSHNLGDIAYKYYSENLRPDLTKEGLRLSDECKDSPSPILDCNKNLHMNTYTVGLGAQGNIYGVTHETIADAYANPPSWPDTEVERDKRMIDDLYHAAINGKGKMFNASTPVELRKELSLALRDIIEQIGSSSRVSFNTGTLNENSLIYSASFDSADWKGDIEARALDPETGDVSEALSWSAAEQLSNQAPNDRVILTYSNNSDDGVPFRWDTSVLDSGQLADLNTSSTGAQDSLGVQRLNFLRGVKTQEGNLFRTRTTVLGDIVHSTPLYVGKPNLMWPDSGPFGTEDNRYSKFKNITTAGRTPVMYAGANDGMLHGFNAQASTSDGGGQEVLAYVPRSVYSAVSGEGLSYLTRPDYQHKFYVDLTPQAVDVFIKGSPLGAADWRTVLVGGLRNGGVGLFALDVTDPSTFSEDNADDIVLWEFNEDDDARLNYVTSEPTVVMMPNNRWAMVVGNGWANGSTASDNKTGVFVIYMDGGIDGTWTEGSDYRFIELAETGGLSAVQPIDTNGDSIVDRLYGGDREGNMWVVDVSKSNTNTNTNTNQWGSAYTSGSTPEPLFTALDSSGNAQPIGSRPLVVRNAESPVGTEGPNGEDFMVYFGTGLYFSASDATDVSSQSFYGVWDRGESKRSTDDLVTRTITEINTGTKKLRSSSSDPIDWTDASGNGRDYGWKMLLPESGERVLNPPQIRGETVFFETFTPSSSACSGGGSSWLMSVALDGSNPDVPAFDANGDNVINDDDLGYIGEQDSENPNIGGTGILDNNQYTSDGKKPKKRKIKYSGSDASDGRLGWQELLSP